MGGVDPSDTFDEPAVEGRMSSSAESLRDVGFLRGATPSGHVHYWGKG